MSERDLVAERDWLTVFLLPAYSPDLNPVEWVRAHVKHSLANLAVMALDQLETLVRNRLERLQYRPHMLNGFIAGTGLTLLEQLSPWRAQVSNRTWSGSRPGFPSDGRTPLMGGITPHPIVRLLLIIRGTFQPTPVPSTPGCSDQDPDHFRSKPGR
ncbi:hypothetical protein [Streptomyces sp. NPDC008122]|uniref:hypothetical protein n=1 Tax=Streptomyces sp. NPDC008122 TaxID=3364810 RepID=UPI0036F06D1A